MSELDSVISLRVSEAELAMLQLVSRHQGMTRSEFIRNSAIATARAIVEKAGGLDGLVQSYLAEQAEQAARSRMSMDGLLDASRQW